MFSWPSGLTKHWWPADHDVGSDKQRGGVLHIAAAFLSGVMRPLQNILRSNCFGAGVSYEGGRREAIVPFR